jgi:hypothetical protein
VKLSSKLADHAVRPLAFASESTRERCSVRYRRKPVSTKPRVDVSEVFQSYSRKLLNDYREGTKASSIAFDRGLPREKAVREFFAKRLPGRYAVGEGLVVDRDGGQSEQCDLIIYDRETTPALSTEQAMSIWLFESVYAVGQVKSTLTESELKSAVANIAAFKRLSRKENKLAGGGGAYHLVGKMNPALGLLSRTRWTRSSPTSISRRSWARCRASTKSTATAFSLAASATG